MFQGLNQRMQLYLVALAITLVCSFLFGAFKVEVKMGKELKEVAELSRQITGQSLESKHTSPALVGLKDYSGAAGGKLAFLGAAAGVGILISRSGISGGGGFGGTSVSTSGTLLGWWLPLAAAIVATVVSVQRILKA